MAIRSWWSHLTAEASHAGLPDSPPMRLEIYAQAFCRPMDGDTSPQYTKLSLVLAARSGALSQQEIKHSQ